MAASVRKPEQLNKWEDLLTPVAYRYNYHCLNSVQKKLYDILLDGIINYKSYVELGPEFNVTERVVGSIFHYLLWDNPAIFVIGEYKMWHALSDNGRRVEIPSLYGNNEPGMRIAVLSEVKKILSHPGLYKMNEIQKELYVHDYIIEHIPYDETCGENGKWLQPYTIYGTLVEGKAVCEGFAKLTKLLLDCLGIETMVISGKVKSIKGWCKC